MAVEVMVRNIRDAFSDEINAMGVYEELLETHPDAAFFSQAYREGQEGLLGEVIDDLNRVGYEVSHGLYDDTDHRQDRHGMMGLVFDSCVGERSPQMIQLKTRNALWLPITEPYNDNVTYNFFGVHLDDRSEFRRTGQVEALLKYVFSNKNMIIGGSINGMHRNDRIAKALRSLEVVAEKLPNPEPHPQIKYPWYARMGSLANRLVGMADGRTIDLLENAFFEDADPDHLPTMGPVQIDHIFTRDVDVLEFKVHEKSEFSDRRAVSAVIQADDIGVSSETPGGVM